MCYKRRLFNSGISAHAFPDVMGRTDVAGTVAPVIHDEDVHGVLLGGFLVRETRPTLFVELPPLQPLAPRRSKLLAAGHITLALLVLLAAGHDRHLTGPRDPRFYRI